LKLTTKYFSV